MWCRQGAAILAALAAQDLKIGGIMSSLDLLKAADLALKTQVATFLADLAGRLATDDPDLDAITADITAQVAALAGADPGPVPPVVPPPAT